MAFLEFILLAAEPSVERVSPSSQALLKALYMATFEVAKMDDVTVKLGKIEGLDDCPYC